MQDEFLILNGDTLFEPRVAKRLIASPSAPLTLAIDRKSEYDEDDMKVSLKDGRLIAVGKTLDPRIVDGESIGFMLFRQEGGSLFRELLDGAARESDAMNRWYLSVVNEMAQNVSVATTSIQGLWWGELDSPADLRHVRTCLADAEKDSARVHRAQFATS